MHRQLIYVLMGGLFLAACGSNTNGSNADGPVTGGRPDTSVIPVDAGASDVAPPLGPDASCDEDAMGVDKCIKNPPGAAQGGGTPVARQNPVPWQSCKLQ